MIRKLQETDRLKVLEYLYQRPSLNIFIIGDIEAFGFEKEYQILYGEFSQDNKYLSVLLFYRDNTVFYSHIDHFNLDWLSIIKQHKFNMFCGKKTLMDRIYPYLSEFKYEEMFFAACKELKTDDNTNNKVIKKLSTKEEAALLYDFLKDISEFNIDKQEKQYFIDGMMNGLSMGVTYYIEENGSIISTAATTAETTINAMVIGVATIKKARNKGLASKIMIHLIKEYLTKGKYLCLFYDNPAAGVIYKRLGFKEIDMWVMANKR